MKLDALIIAAVVAGLPVHAKEAYAQGGDKQQQEQESLDEEWQPTVIGHDDVEPFPEPEPNTVTERAGIKFKPMLVVKTGCEPYPAVNEAGETSGGLKPSGAPDGECQGSKHGSQVYGRATWFNDIWTIMFAWYFAKDSPMPLLGHRHDWENIVLFIDNPAHQNPKILGCSTSWHSGYIKYAPCPEDFIDGYNVMIKYEHSFPLNHALNITKDAGEFQDLIMWHQLSDLARLALNKTDFGDANTPMNDLNFKAKISDAWPFETEDDEA